MLLCQILKHILPWFHQPPVCVVVVVMCVCVGGCSVFQYTLRQLVKTASIMDFVCKRSSTRSAVLWIINCTAVGYVVCFHSSTIFIYNGPPESQGYKHSVSMVGLQEKLAFGDFASQEKQIEKKKKRCPYCSTCGWIQLSSLAATLICHDLWQQTSVAEKQHIMACCGDDLWDSHNALFVYCMLPLPAYNIWPWAKEEPSGDSVPLHKCCICQGGE